MIKNNVIRFCAFLLPMLLSVVAFAQEKSTDINVDINKGGGGWYTNPIVWIVGAAVFILLLVALLRGGNRSSNE